MAVLISVSSNFIVPFLQFAFQYCLGLAQPLIGSRTGYAQCLCRFIKNQSPKQRIDGTVALLDCYVGLYEHYTEYTTAI